MALIKCPECGKMISEFADKCIGCGIPMAKIKEINSKEKDHITTKKIIVAYHPIYGRGTISNQESLSDGEIIKVLFEKGYVRLFKLPDKTLTIKEENIVIQKNVKREQSSDKDAIMDDSEGLLEKYERLSDKYESVDPLDNYDDYYEQEESYEKRFSYEKSTGRDYYEEKDVDDMDGEDYMDNGDDNFEDY